MRKALALVLPAARNTRGGERGVYSNRRQHIDCILLLYLLVVLNLVVPPCAPCRMYNIRPLQQSLNLLIGISWSKCHPPRVHQMLHCHTFRLKKGCKSQIPYSGGRMLTIFVFGAGRNGSPSADIWCNIILTDTHKTKERCDKKKGFYPKMRFTSTLE